MSLVTDYLGERGVVFEVVPHRRAFTSLQEARELGVAADDVLKTVAVRTRGKYVLAVVPASRRLDLRLVRESLDDPDARLASEAELVADFPGFELGALPPLGSLLGVPLLVDPEVLSHETVLFAAGTETESIRVRAGELFRDEPLTLRQLTRWNGRASEEPISGWNKGSPPRLDRASDRLAIYEEQTHQDRRLAEEIREAAGDLVNRISRAGSSA